MLVVVPRRSILNLAITLLPVLFTNRFVTSFGGHDELKKIRKFWERNRAYHVKVRLHSWKMADMCLYAKGMCFAYDSDDTLRQFLDMVIDFIHLLQIKTVNHDLIQATEESVHLNLLRFSQSASI